MTHTTLNTLNEPTMYSLICGPIKYNILLNKKNRIARVMSDTITNMPKLILNIPLAMANILYGSGVKPAIATAHMPYLLKYSSTFPVKRSGMNRSNNGLPPNSPNPYAKLPPHTEPAVLKSANTKHIDGLATLTATRKMSWAPGKKDDSMKE